MPNSDTLGTRTSEDMSENHLSPEQQNNAAASTDHAVDNAPTTGIQLDIDMPDFICSAQQEPKETLLAEETTASPKIVPQDITPQTTAGQEANSLHGPQSDAPQPDVEHFDVVLHEPQPLQPPPLQQQPPIPAAVFAAVAAAPEADVIARQLITPADSAEHTRSVEFSTPAAASASTALGSIFPTSAKSAPKPAADHEPGNAAHAEQPTTQQPEQPQPEQPGQGGKPQRPLSLFEPVEILRGGMLPEDLPFANEVDAALARRPLRMERYLSLAVGCGILLFILWAAFASIDEVTHAEGQVISSQRTQAIQNLEGGILRNILVSEGQTVEKGDALAQLDNELAASSYRDAINKALDNTLAIIRLEAERKGEVPQFPEKVEEWVQDVVGPQNMVTALPQAHQAIKDQMSAYQARTQQKNAELLLLDSQYQQRIHEVGELTARKRQLDESLALAVEQRDISAGLLQKRSTSRVDYLNQQQRVVQLSGEVEALASTIPKAQSAAQETSQRMTFRKAEIDAAVTDELNKRRMDLASINETLSAGGDRVTRTELRSPVRGTVKRIAITTLGGVVKPGESIMEIVPLDDTLLVEAKVRPADVAFLRPGQRAMVKVSAYDFSIYGGLEGALEQISADTIEDKRGEFYYLVKVRTNKTAIQHQDKSLPIIPGMMATVDILIGKKTVLDYLLKPILKARERALRER